MWDRLEARISLFRARRASPDRLPPSWLDDPVVVAGVRQAVRAFWSAVLDVQRERLWWLGSTRNPRHVVESFADLDIGARIAALALGAVLLSAAITLLFGLVWIFGLAR
jgi:hypothetical protein